MDVQAPLGTEDILPEQAAVWQRVEGTARAVFARYGYGEIRTPIFESTRLFVRSIGETTDIVEKEMYTLGEGDDSLTLRPEATAPVVRAYLQHNLHKIRAFQKLYYIGPMFRHERPQAGRKRQFHQIGVEAMGATDPLLDAEVIAVMAGDAQMDPGDLPDVLRPITSGTADYAKGNRLLVDDVRRQMPGYRFYGNAVLTILTKFATGYYHVIDPQCGYTAISARALRAIHIDEMTKGYGYNADILTRLNILNFRVADVAVRPVYGEAVSGIKLRRYVPRVSWLLSKLFFKRLKEKYLIRDFHPVVLFYLAAMVLTPLAVFLGGWIVEHYLVNHRVSVPTVTLFAIFALFAGQAACFAMWIDMDYNKHLNAQFGRPIGSRAPSGGAEPAAGEE